MEVALVIWLLFGVVTAVVATNKGLNGCLWFVLGVLLGPFGFILSLVVSKNQPALEQAAVTAGNMRKCPYCAELIKAQAIKCRFCGADLPQAVAAHPTPSSEIRLSPQDEERERLAAGVPAGQLNRHGPEGEFVGNPTWLVVVDRLTEQQRRTALALAAEMNFRENEIAPFGENGIKIVRQLTVGEANALMARFHAMGITSKKIRS